MRKKKRLQYFLLAQVIPACLVLFVNLIFWQRLSYTPSYPSIYGYIILPFIALISSFWYLHTARYGAIYMLTPVIFGSTLIYGSAFSTVIPLPILLISVWARQAKTKRALFEVVAENLRLFLAISLSTLFYSLLSRASFHLSSSVAIWQFLLLLISILLYTFIFQFLLTYERVVMGRVDERYFLKFNWKLFKVSLVTLMPLAILIAIVTAIDPRALFLLAPIYVMYSSMKSYIEISSEVRAAIEDIALAYEKRDPYSACHSMNVARISEMIARELLLSDEEVEKIVSAAKIHDIGNIGIADSILEKGKYNGLTPEEFAEIRKHPITGHNVTTNLSWYREESDMIYYHHEKFDGSGYPKGLKGEEIPLGARILAVAEAYDAMASPRAYRDALSEDFIIDELKNKSGTQFDPDVISALLEILYRRKD